MNDQFDLRELYGKAKKYLEEGKKDPETEPFKSKYKAMEYLKIMKEKLAEAVDKSDESHRKELQGKLAVVLLHMGVISIDTEEISAGEKYLNETLSMMPNEQDSSLVLVALTARNQLGILWCHRAEYEKAKVFLEECEAFYSRFMASGRTDHVKSLHEHFDEIDEAFGINGYDEVEKVHTLTKFYLAQVYGKLGDSMKSAIYCHETLRRQLESKQYDAVDWALNAATLSQFFMERKLLTQARHHLAAASYMLDRHEDVIKTLEVSEDEMEAKREELKHRGADVSRCWAKFGIFVLEQSHDNEDEAESLPGDHENLEDRWFTSLELPEYENQLTDSLVKNFDEARDVMLVTQKFLMAAKEYYSLEDHASDYVQIVQDHSTLIKHLSRFENDDARLCKMLKKRINMLEDVLKELNPQYYLHVCRALWFELGETYHELMHKKHTKISANGGPPNPMALTKANQLAEQSIRNFNRFLDSVKDKHKNQLPEPLPDDLLRPTLVAHFILGRLHYKLVTPDKRQALLNTHEAICCFKYLVDYCKAHPKGLSAVYEEYQVSEEMMSLLELKMKQNVNLIA